MNIKLIYILCITWFLSSVSISIVYARNDSISIQNLSEVLVQGSSRLQFGDRTKIYITRDMRRGNHTTAQMLSNLPNFYYDWTQNKLMYNNNSNIVVLVDSVEKSLDAIMNMQHIRYDQVEIITKPIGQYQGYDVLINFHTKENYEGYEGNLFHNSGFVFNNATEHRFLLDNDYGSITYTKNKLTLFAWCNMSMTKDGHNEWYEQYYKLNGLRNSVAQNPNGSKNSITDYLYGNTVLSADYAFSKYRSISFAYDFNTYKDNGSNDVTIDRTFDDDRANIRLRQTMSNRNRTGEHSVGIFYHDNSKKVKFSTDVNYRYMSSHYRNKMDETTGFTLDNNFRDHRNFLRYRLSGWTRLADRRLYLSTNYIGTWKSYSRRNYTTHEKLNSNGYLRNRLSGTMSYTFARNAQMSATVWAEHIHLMSGNQVGNQIPVGGNLMFFQKLKGKNWIRLNYDCSVEYPDQTISTEYGYFIDSLTWSGGNPWLKSNVGHHFRIWFDAWNCFNIQAGCTLSPNRFCPITEVAEGILPSGTIGTYARRTYQNSDYKEWWASTSLTKRFRQNILYKADMKYVWVRAKYLSEANSGHGLIFSTSLNYYWPQIQTNINIQYRYTRSLNIFPQSHRVSNNEIPSISMQRTFCKNRLDLQMSYSMMFHFFNANHETFEDTPALYVWTMDKAFDRQRNNLVISLRYRFSGGKSVRQYNRDLSKEE